MFDLTVRPPICRTGRRSAGWAPRRIRVVAGAARSAVPGTVSTTARPLRVWREDLAVEHLAPAAPPYGGGHPAQPRESSGTRSAPCGTPPSPVAAPPPLPPRDGRPLPVDRLHHGPRRHFRSGGAPRPPPVASIGANAGLRTASFVPVGTYSTVPGGCVMGAIGRAGTASGGGCGHPARCR